MSLVLDDRQITRVKLIDDDPGVRGAYRYSVEEMDLDSIEVFGPIEGFDSLARELARSDAAICDYNLKIRNYSNINGDQVVSGLYQRQVPVVLCTRFEGNLPLGVRNYLRHIPVVLPPNEVSAARLMSAFEICVREFKGVFSASRKPHRAQIRVEGGEFPLTRDTVIANVIVPSWDPKQFVSIEVPNTWAVFAPVAECIRRGDVARLFAHVNLGAECADELFLTEWSER